MDVLFSRFEEASYTDCAGEFLVFETVSGAVVFTVVMPSLRGLMIAERRVFCRSTLM